MARTLTAGATTWKAGPGYSYDWLIESSDLGIHWSFDEEAAGSFTWEHRILAISEIEQALPPAGGLASTMTVTITVAVDGTGQCPCLLWSTLGKLDGADLSVSLLPAGEAYADKITIFTGKIDSFRWTTGTASGGGVGTLIASDPLLQQSDVLLPTTVISSDLFPNAPDDSLGKALALFYGTTTSYLPFILVDANAREYRCAGHGIFKLGNGHYIFAARGLRPFVASNSGTGDASAASLTLDSPLTEYEHTSGALVLSVSRESNVTDSANAIDGDSGTVAEIGTGDINADGDGYGELGIKASISGDITGINTVVATISQHVRKASGATTVTGSYVLRVIDDSTDVLSRDALLITQEYRHQSNPRDETFRLTPIQLENTHAIELLAKAINEGGAGGANDAWQIGEIDLDAFYQASDAREPIYSAQNETGRLDPDGSITGGSAGDLITLMSDVLRSILVELLGVSVDTTSFDAARSVQSDAGAIDFALDLAVGSDGWYLERVNGQQLLHDLATQARSYLFAAGDGTVKILPYDSTASSQYDFTISDILSLTIDLSQPELITNSVEVNAGWDPVRRQFGQHYYASPSGSNHTVGATNANLIAKCTDSYARYGERRHLVVDAYGLLRAGHGPDLLAHLIDYFWTQLVTVDLETTFVGIHLEVGDFITVTHPEMPANENGQTFEILRITHIPEVEGSRPAPIRIRAVRAQRLEMTYFAINDQDDVTWYWWVGPDNTLWWDTTAPAPVTRFATDLALSPTPYWLEIGGTPHYVYPTTTGEPTVETSAPATGTGYSGSPTVRGQAWPFADWNITVDTDTLEWDITEV